MPNAVMLYVTCPSDEVARAIALQLVKNRLVACVTVTAPATSYYEWQGTLEQASEVILFAKTMAEHAASATQTILAAHPYECPCIVQWPLSGGHAPFLQWIQAQTGPAYPPAGDS